MAYELVARPNFTIPGKDVPLRQAGPSAFDQEAVQRARAAAEARRVPQGVPNAGTTQVSSAGVQGRPQGPVGPAGVGAPATTSQVDGARGGGVGDSAGSRTLREGLKAQPGFIGKTAYAAGRVVPLLAKGAGVAGVASSFGDYKIDNPAVDSSAMGTFRALRDGDMAGVGRSLSKGALETLMDVGSGVAKTADFFLPGDPLSTRYDKALRGQFGNQLVGPTTDPTAPSPTAAAAPAAVPTKDYFPPVEKPPLSVNASSAEIAAANPNGRVTTSVGPGGIREFSGTNISGPVSYVTPSGKLADFAPGNMNVVPGMSKELIAQTLARPVDPLRGLSPSARAAYDEQVRYAQGVNAMGAAMAPGRGGSSGGGAGGDLNAAVKSLRDAGHVVTHSTLRALIGDQTQRRGQDMTEGTTRRGQDMTQQTALRGQDMDLQGRIMPKQMEMEMAARMRSLRAQAWDASGGDPRRMASILAGQGLDTKDAMDFATSVQNYGSKSEEQARGIFKNAFDTPTGKDGAVVARPDLEAAAYRKLMEMTGGKFTSMNKDQQDLLSSQAVAEVKELDQANQNRPGGPLASIGLGARPTPYSNLPSAADQAKATLRRPTLVERFNPFDEYTMGADNWVEEMPDDRKYVYGNLPESRIKSRLDSGVKQK